MYFSMLSSFSRFSSPVQDSHEHCFVEISGDCTATSVIRGSCDDPLLKSVFMVSSRSDDDFLIVNLNSGGFVINSSGFAL